MVICFIQFHPELTPPPWLEKRRRLPPQEASTEDGRLALQQKADAAVKRAKQQARTVPCGSGTTCGVTGDAGGRRVELKGFLGSRTVSRPPLTRPFSGCVTWCSMMYSMMYSV